MVNRLLGIFSGGGETFDYNIAKTLTYLGHNVLVLTGKPLFSSKKNEIYDIRVKYIRSPYIRWISYKTAGKIPKVPTFFMLLDLYIFSIFAFIWIKENEKNFDIIQILNIPILSKWIVDNLKKPVVVRFPGPPSNRWELSIYRCIKNKDLIKFFTNGDALRYLKLYNFEADDIPPGVNTERFIRIENIPIRKRYNISDKDILLISCRRIIPGKGFEFLIDVFEIALKNNRDLKLMIIGDGLIRKELEKKVFRSGIQDYVIFTGRIENTDLPEFYSSADIFLLLSQYENFSNAVLEAMSCELPIIATNVGGFPLQIEDNENGFLVKYGDVNTTVEKILHLANNPDIRVKMGKTNRKKILENYSWEKTAKKVLDLYKSLL